MSQMTSLLRWLHPATVPPKLRGWVIPLAGLFLWWAAYRFQWTDSQFFVPISKVLETGLHMTQGGEIFIALGASLYRMLLGFAFGSLLGLAVGTLLGVSRLAERMVGPSFHTVKQVSLFAWIPLISLWFGLGDLAKIAFLSLAAFFPVVLNTFEGIRSVAREHVEVARIFAYSRWQLFAKVVLPSAAPSIFTGIYLALIYAWLATLGAEYLLTSGVGIGNLLTDGREHFWMDQVLLGIVVVGIVGFVLNWTASKVEARLLRWRSAQTAQF